jgi:hypothetical protein
MVLSWKQNLFLIESSFNTLKTRILRIFRQPAVLFLICLGLIIDFLIELPFILLCHLKAKTVKSKDKKYWQRL